MSSALGGWLACYPFKALVTWCVLFLPSYSHWPYLPSVGIESLAFFTSKHRTASFIETRTFQVPYPMTICEWWSKEWQRTILPLGSFASVTLLCPTLVPLKFWWLFPCGLKVLVQNSVLHHLFLPKTLSLGKAIYSCYSCHLHPASLKNWTKIIFLWGLSLPGGPQTQYMRSKLIHFLSEPVLPSLSLWFQQFRLWVRVNFSWC